MFKNIEDKAELGAFSLTIFTGCLLAHSQIISSKLPNDARILVGVAGLALIFAGAQGAYMVGRNTKKQ